MTDTTNNNAEPTPEQMFALCQMTTKNEAGQHFTQIYDYGDLEANEWIEIGRPVSDSTGLQYSQDYWSVEVTEEGMDWVEHFAADPWLYVEEIGNDELTRVFG